MSRFRVTVTEISGHPDGVTPPTETEIFKVVIDSFEPAAFTKAITQSPRRKRRAKADSAS